MTAWCAICRVSYRQAIVTWNASTFIANNANLIGTVTTDVNEAAYFDDSLINNGFWNSAGGLSDFGRGTQDTVINAGVIVAADDSTQLETTTIARIEYFNNEDGVISLIDGQAGDIFQIMSRGNTPAEAPLQFYGSGQLLVDAALGPPGDGLADEFHIFASTLLGLHHDCSCQCRFGHGLQFRRHSGCGHRR